MKYPTAALLLGTVLTTFVFSDAKDTCNLTQYLEFGRRGVVNCGFEEDFILIAWLNSTTDVQPLVEMRDSVKSGRGYNSGEFDIYPNGSLIIHEVNFQHDHPFMVWVVDKLGTATSIVIHVVVTVPPNPPYPVVEGCDNDRYCVLEVGREGVVTCSLRGIRPEVQLELTTFQSDFMDFWNEQLVVTEHTNGTYDISLTSDFTINLPPFNRVTVVCRTLSYEMSTQFDLLYHIGKIKCYDHFTDFTD
ncbi:hypothetical protein HOLleu_00950 [Holothuria leucospilota]|uniref:Uncharacterized protein n=1 Tax=Holothuria leucospilota TaxID=206669 RepID=A0A9Q1HIZ5_HOLLE|nr:hypothetical protein HOLleu_00950 [Holothuria leucospilota]